MRRAFSPNVLKRRLLGSRTEWRRSMQLCNTLACRIVIVLQEVIMWVFGYGSLMWADWAEKRLSTRSVKAILPNFRRAFNKASVRNWGSLERPGPTLNLVDDPGSECQGIAFEFPFEAREIVASALRKREGKTLFGRNNREWSLRARLDSDLHWPQLAQEQVPCRTNCDGTSSPGFRRNMHRVCTGNCD